MLAVGRSGAAWGDGRGAETRHTDDVGGGQRVLLFLFF